MTKKDNTITCVVLAEIAYADNRYGDFRSTHEGLGVLIEEVRELEDAIRANDKTAVEREALQVAAVAIRLVRSLDSLETERRSGF